MISTVIMQVSLRWSLLPLLLSVVPCTVAVGPRDTYRRSFPRSLDLEKPTDHAVTMMGSSLSETVIWKPHK
jgi:hypothetical protein